jgi:hypothetical protein
MRVLRVSATICGANIYANDVFKKNKRPNRLTTLAQSRIRYSYSMNTVTEIVSI